MNFWIYSKEIFFKGDEETDDLKDHHANQIGIRSMVVC
jgi:hypothetical protein